MHATVWRHLVKAMDVTAGLAESNGSLLQGVWLKVTCGLTACRLCWDQPDPTFGNEYGKTVLYLYCIKIFRLGNRKDNHPAENLIPKVSFMVLNRSCGVRLTKRPV